MTTMYRHGDVLLVPVKLTGDETKKKEVGQLTIALGEGTGHHHTLYGEGIVPLSYNEKKYFQVREETQLKHQEHHALTIVPLPETHAYEIRIEQEFDYFEKTMRKVVD